MEPILYTLDDLENILKVSRRTLFRIIKDGRLQAVKVGRTWRVTQESLDAFLQAAPHN